MRIIAKITCERVFLQYFLRIEIDTRRKYEKGIFKKNINCDYCLEYLAFIYLYSNLDLNIIASLLLYTFPKTNHKKVFNCNLLAPFAIHQCLLFCVA